MDSTDGDHLNNTSYEEIRSKFNKELCKLFNSNKNKRSTLLTFNEYREILDEVKEAQSLKQQGKPLSSKQYRRLQRYDVSRIGQEEKLVGKRHNDDGDFQFYAHREQLFAIVHSAHISTGHKREKGMEKELKKKYANVTREVIQAYITNCQVCQLKKMIPKKDIVVRPIISNSYTRCQVDLIDMQTEPDGHYKFILSYKDYSTKFVVLKPLKTNTAQEVASHLIDIFCLLGAPCIVQSNEGRKFSKSIINELVLLWPDLKIVHGRPRHSRCQDVRDMLAAWASDRKSTKWSDSLKFIQSQKNRSFHMGIGKSPYEAMFGSTQKNGLLDADLPREMVDALQTEEQLEKLLNGIADTSIEKNQRNEPDTNKLDMARISVPLSDSQSDSNDIIDEAEFYEIETKFDTRCNLININPDGLYTIEMSEGHLDRLQTDSSFVSTDIEIQCNCKRYCIHNKCSCKQKNVKCNSKCHGSMACKNK